MEPSKPDCGLANRCRAWERDNSCGENCRNFARGCFARNRIEAPRPSDFSGSTGLTGYKERLIKHAATLLMKRLSDIDEDYPPRFPKHVLRDIEKHNERLRVIAIDLRSIADAL